MSEEENKVNNEGVDGGKIWSYSKLTPIKTVPHQFSAKAMFTFGSAFIVLVSFAMAFVLSIVPLTFIYEKFGMRGAIVLIFIMVPASVGFGILLYRVTENIVFWMTERFGLRDTKRVYIEHMPWFIALSVFFVMIVTCAGLIFNDSPLLGETGEAEKAAYMEEYGYSEISFPLSGKYASVEDANGKEMEVGLMEYKDTFIPYENPDQLAEKMKKVDAGTFLKTDEDTTTEGE